MALRLRPWLPLLRLPPIPSTGERGKAVTTAASAHRVPDQPRSRAAAVARLGSRGKGPHPLDTSCCSVFWACRLPPAVRCAGARVGSFPFESCCELDALPCRWRYPNTDAEKLDIKQLPCGAGCTLDELEQACLNTTGCVAFNTHGAQHFAAAGGPVVVPPARCASPPATP